MTETKSRTMLVSLAGNPNAGKSTLFNALTGARAKVANYPGVTVERKSAQMRLPAGTLCTVVDVPGCYSLTARSPEEDIAYRVLCGEAEGQEPDVVVCVVDATDLARGLYLTCQLLEWGLPTMVALTMLDVVGRRGQQVDVALLSERLGGIPVIPVRARVAGTGSASEPLAAVGERESFVGTGLRRLRRAIEEAVQQPRPTPQLALNIEDARAVEACQVRLREQNRPWSLGAALWHLSSDAAASSAVCSDLAAAASPSVDDRLVPLASGDVPSFARRVIQARFAKVDALSAGVLTPPTPQTASRTQRLDRVLLHPVWGLVAFMVTAAVLFQAVFAWADPLIGGVEWVMGWVAEGIRGGIPSELPLVRSLVVDGLVAGVGNVLVFLPQIALLFLGIALLEESGYMARAACLMDRLMRRVGLHGKAFLPLLSSLACAVPGIMAARTVESTRDRLATIFIAPFMSCSARLPVYLMVIGAVFATSEPVLGVLSLGGLVMAGMYGLGFAAALATGWVLKRTLLRAPLPALVMALPDYRWPSLRTVLGRVLERCRVFVVQTGTIIMCLSVLLWAGLTFPGEGLGQAERAKRVAAIEAQALSGSAYDAAVLQLEQDDAAQRLQQSFGGRLGRAIEPVVEPLGFDWRIGIGLVASFAAREVLVSTLGQVYALGSEVEAESPMLRDALLADIDPTTGAPWFTPLRGLSLMVFFVLAMQCLSTVATVRRETNSWRWALGQLVYMNVLAYLASLAVYQGGLWLGWGL